jgi:transposase
MPSKPRPIVIALTDGERETLNGLVRSRTAPLRHVERAAIILGLVAGRTASEMARELGIDRQRVQRCVKRVEQVGVEAALDDLPRAGRQPDITTEARLWLVGQACIQPKNVGYPHELWTLRLLAGHARCEGLKAGHKCLAELAPSTVWKILDAQAIRPDKVEYYLEKRDPLFDDRLGAVLDVYCAAEMLREMPEADRPVAIFSYDEKPGIQAIATTAPDRPPAATQKPTQRRRNKTRRTIATARSAQRAAARQKSSAKRRKKRHGAMQRDYEYKRLGTVTLSAAVNLINGIVHHAITGRHRSREFIAFLKNVDAACAEGILICILMDNHSAHKSKETRAYLTTRPDRFEFVFTPVHGSWLNYVETFFSRASRSVLRHIRVNSKTELTDRLNQYITMCNAKPLVPTWIFGVHNEQKAV